MSARRLSSTEERSIARHRFEDLLRQTRTCYFTNTGILRKNSKMYEMFEVYSLMIATSETRVDKFNIILSAQNSFMPTLEAPRGYILEYLHYLQENFSRQESMNTLYCAYGVKEDTFIFKPVSWMLNYFNVIKKSKNFEDVRKRRSQREYAIRIDPMEKKESGQDFVMEPRTMSGRVKRKLEKYTYHVGTNQQAMIEHKERLIMTEEEIKKFLKEHNSYPDGWKLKFKVATNLLTEGELI